MLCLHGPGRVLAALYQQLAGLVAGGLDLGISTSGSGAAVNKRRAMSPVWASAIVLLRLPIRIETATTQAPFGTRGDPRCG